MLIRPVADVDSTLRCSLKCLIEKVAPSIVDESVLSTTTPVGALKMLLVDVASSVLPLGSSTVVFDA